ncbi:MAG: hypothetical protein M3209_20640 [Acidobacteriota bacterium]|nr:hypothetical protein [Acidobacteriota bacterium]
MLRKPNFCCECGEKIEKENLKWWDSRKFCNECERHHDKLPNRILKYFVLAFIFTGIGFIIANSVKQRNPTTAWSQNQANLAPQQIVNRQVAQTNQTVGLQPANKPTNQNAAQKTPQILTPAPPQALPDIAETTETAYYCGARTQKGTPCSRRVRVPGRCWQHVGKPAMVSQEKLKIAQ